MQVVEDQLGPRRDPARRERQRHRGPHTPDGGWHVDSPITQMPEPLPNFTLSLQTVWMLDDFRRENGATHVARGSHLTLRKPPTDRDELPNDVVLEAPAGSLAIWFSQSWHRHGANTTRRNTTRHHRPVRPMLGQTVRRPTQSNDRRPHAAALSPRLRYMMGCNANPPVRG